LKKIFVVLCVLAGVFGSSAGAQRRPVLPQIDEPHPYYYRELYLPQLTSGPSSLSWSPDSTELVYSMGGTLWKQKLDSNVAQQLTDGPGYDYQPDWSPDGKSVVYVAYQKDAMELWLLDLATGASRQLTTGGAVNVEPRWSPDGKKIVWVSTQYNRRFHVFLADVSGGSLQNATRLTGETKSSLPRYYYSAYDMEINPVWTRDGKEILFVSNCGHIYGTGGFWRMKAVPGAETREIHYEETSWKARPDFSPDGSRMVYSSYLGRQWQNLWVMPANGGDAFPISYGDWDQTNPRWSPDGKRLAYISNQGGPTSLRVLTIPGTQDSELVAETRAYSRLRGTLELSVVDDADENIPARISIEDQAGRFYAPDDAWMYADDGFDRKERDSELRYFHGSGISSLTVPVGEVTIRVSKGLETRPEIRKVEIQRGQLNNVRVKLKPLEGDFAASDKWLSWDLHVHVNYGGTYRNDQSRLMQQKDAEGLQVIHELTVNKEQRFPDVGSVSFPQEFWEKRAAEQDWQLEQGQEFHTSYWGHRGILGLNRHLLLPGYAGYPNTAAASLYPMNADVYDMAHAQGAVVGAVHPFDEVPDPFAKPGQRITDELPVDVALGKLDYMEIVGFSDHKSTAEVWYRLLNLGFKIPAGAGTDATANYAAPIRGQVGFDRVYVWMPGWPSPSVTWMDELKQGRTFATNGPLLEFKLGGETVGSELKPDVGQNAVPFAAKLRSIVPVDHLEVVCNGNVAQTLKLDGVRESVDATGTIPINDSGWCVLRAWSDKAAYPVLDNYAYATTSPVYVTVGGKRAYSKKDAEYFEAWIDRTMEITEKYPDWNSAEEKAYVMKKLHEAHDIYEHLH
jgi:TolB protein